MEHIISPITNVVSSVFNAIKSVLMFLVNSIKNVVGSIFKFTSNSLKSIAGLFGFGKKKKWMEDYNENLRTYIGEASRSFGVPPQLLQCTILFESKFLPNYIVANLQRQAVETLRCVEVKALASNFSKKYFFTTII